jgi:hypothetical protein
MYLQNPRLYVTDLQAAAESEDWERYAAVQKQFAVESTLSALQQAEYQVTAAKNARHEALQEMEANHPGFSDRLSAHRDTLQTQRPRLHEAISFAEQRGGQKEELVGLYETANDVLRVHGDSHGDRQGDRNADSYSPSPSQATESLRSSTARQRLIQAFEEKYGDVPVDLGDDSERVFRY